MYKESLTVWGKGPKRQFSWQQMTRYGRFIQITKECWCDACRQVSKPEPASWWQFQPNDNWRIRPIINELNEDQFEWYFALERRNGKKRVYFMLAQGGGYWDRFEILSPPPMKLVRARQWLERNAA